MNDNKQSTTCNLRFLYILLLFDHLEDAKLEILNVQSALAPGLCYVEGVVQCHIGNKKKLPT